MKNKTRASFFLLSACICIAPAFAGDRINSQVFQLRLAVPEMPNVAAPVDYDKMDLFRVDLATGKTNQQVLYVERKTLLDQNDIKGTKVVLSKPSGQPEISITFTDQGRKHFAEVTRQNIGKQLAIIIAGHVYCAPVIRTEISTGKAEVSGSFSQQEAKDLSRQINEALKK